MDLFSPGSATAPNLAQLEENIWVGPVPDDRVLAGDPAEVAVGRESIRLAFIAALQKLAPRQRAVLILREVLAWSAAETAELLDSTVASVNSALQRARATLAEESAASGDTAKPLDEEQREFLAKYVKAFEAFDIDGLTALLRADVSLNMPPYQLWLQGIEELRGLVERRRGRLPRLAAAAGRGQRHAGVRAVPGRRGRRRLDAVGDHGPGDPATAGSPASATILDTERLFPLFGVPARLRADGSGE